jgi:hypothetical protein
MLIDVDCWLVMIAWECFESLTGVIDNLPEAFGVVALTSYRIRLEAS